MLFLLGLPEVFAEPVDPASASADGSGDTTSVEVFFVTNRDRQEGQTTVETYGIERGRPGYGRCVAEFSSIPMMNELASRVRFYVPTESSEIQALDIPDAEAFWRQVAAAAAQTTTGSVVLFVHGYNYGFERTCRMAAEMQRGLAGRATVVAFSWPSNAKPADYVSDQADLEWSVPLLAYVMARLNGQFGADRVQVVAHSLGSRGVMFGLERLEARIGYRPLIARLVFLAPDFDAQTFVGRLPDLVPLAGDITVYASSQDTPLQFSQTLSGYPRLGQAGEYLTIEPGMETIDVSPAGRYQILGHEYFYYHPSVAADLVDLLVTGRSAAERPGLRRRERAGRVYWEIPSLSN